MSANDQNLSPFEARVDDVLRGKITSFRRIFLGTVIVGLGLFYFVVLPYLSSHTERSGLLRAAQTLEVELGLAKRSVAAHTDVIDRLATAVDAAYRMRGTLIDGGYHLDLRDQAVSQARRIADWKREFAGEPDAADWIRGEVARPNFSAAFYHSHPTLDPPFRDPCFWLDAPLWTYCRISQALQQHHHRLERALGDTSEKLPVGFKMAELKARLDGIVAPFLRWADAPDPAAISEISSVRQILSRSLEGYRVAIVEAQQLAQDSAAGAAKEVGRIETALVGIRERVTHAEAKLAQTRKFQSLETPIGTLPVGLDELVLLFPIVLVLVVCHLLDLLDQSVALRRTLHCSLRERDVLFPGGPAAYLRMTCALWIEPFDGPFRRSVQALVLAIPMVAAATAAYVALDPDFLFSDKVIQDPVTRMAFLLGYLLAAGLLACLVWRVGRTARAYRRWMRETSTPADGDLSVARDQGAASERSRTQDSDQAG